MFTAHVKTPSHTSTFEGSYDACMGLLNALRLFPADTMKVEILDDDCNVKYKWVSPDWFDEESYRD